MNSRAKAMCGPGGGGPVTGMPGLGGPGGGCCMRGGNGPGPGRPGCGGGPGFLAGGPRGLAEVGNHIIEFKQKSLSPTLHAHGSNYS